MSGTRVALGWGLSMCGLVALLGLNACSTQPTQLDSLTQPEPNNTRQRAMRRLSLASAYYEQGQNEVAQQEIRAALQIDPHFADAFSLLGLIHQRDNRPVLAQQSFEQALKLAAQPTVPVADLAAIEHNYGWFLCEQNRFAQAQTQFEQALSRVGYRYVEKTRNAMGLCKEREAIQAGATKSNN